MIENFFNSPRLVEKWQLSKAESSLKWTAGNHHACCCSGSKRLLVTQVATSQHQRQSPRNLLCHLKSWDHLTNWHTLSKMGCNQKESIRTKCMPIWTMVLNQRYEVLVVDWSIVPTGLFSFITDLYCVKTSHKAKEPIMSQGIWFWLYLTHWFTTIMYLTVVHHVEENINIQDKHWSCGWQKLLLILHACAVATFTTSIFCASQIMWWIRKCLKRLCVLFHQRMICM